MLIAGVIVAAYFLIGVGFWLAFAFFVVPVRSAFGGAPRLLDHLIVLFLWVFVLVAAVEELPHD